jgi:hypothetical protein
MWIRLYDEARTPPHWLNVIRPGEYCVFVMTADSRAATDGDGMRFRAGEASVMIAADMAEALRFAGTVVKAHPQLCCEVYDHEGKSGEPRETIYDDSVRGRYQGLPLAKREMWIGSAFVAGASIFIVYDALHSLAWMWGYIVGLKLLVIGTSYLVRGVAGLIEHRADS